MLGKASRAASWRGGARLLFWEVRGDEKVPERPMTNRQALNVTVAMVSALSAPWHQLGIQIRYLSVRTAVAERLRGWVETSGLGAAAGPSLQPPTQQLGRVGFTERLFSIGSRRTPWVHCVRRRLRIPPRTVVLDVFGGLQPT